MSKERDKDTKSGNPKEDPKGDTTVIKEVKGDDRDRITIEVGDSKEEKFKPQFKVSRWNNLANFSLRAEEDPNAIIEIDGEKIKYIAEKYEVHQYEKPDAGEDGGFEFEWVLKEPPKTNVLEATIKTKNLDFHYQGELFQEEIDLNASRPENAIGSYAAYYSGPRVLGQDFRTGKAFHIYRPEAIDADGKRSWCDLHIDAKAGILMVTIPQEFLDTAVYPIIVDPTFGYTSIGASNFGGSPNICCGTRGTTPDNGTVDSISCYFDQANTGKNIKGTLYSDAVSPLRITDGIGNAVVGGAAAGWRTSVMGTPPTIAAGTTYYVGVVQDNSFNGFRYDTGGVANQMKYGSLTYASPEATWSSPSNFTWFLSVYATYTVAASGDTGNWFF